MKLGQKVRFTRGLFRGQTGEVTRVKGDSFVITMDKDGRQVVVGKRTRRDVAPKAAWPRHLFAAARADGWYRAENFSGPDSLASWFRQKADVPSTILRGITNNPEVHDVIERALSADWPIQQFLTAMGTTGLTASQANLVVQRYSLFKDKGSFKMRKHIKSKKSGIMDLMRAVDQMGAAMTKLEQAETNYARVLKASGLPPGAITQLKRYGLKISQGMSAVDDALMDLESYINGQINQS